MRSRWAPDVWSAIPCPLNLFPFPCIKQNISGLIKLGPIQMKRLTLASGQGILWQNVEQPIFKNAGRRSKGNVWQQKKATPGNYSRASRRQVCVSVAKRKPFPDPEKDGIRGNYVSVVHLKESVVFVEILMFLINGFMIYENEDCMQAWCWFSVLGHSLRPKIRRSSKSVVFCSGTQTASLPIKLDTYPFN